MDKIAVLMGGTSSEREVSLVSGKNVADALASLGKYEVVPVDLKSDSLDGLPDGVDRVYIALHGADGDNTLGVDIEIVLAAVDMNAAAESRANADPVLAAAGNMDQSVLLKNDLAVTRIVLVSDAIGSGIVQIDRERTVALNAEL